MPVNYQQIQSQIHIMGEYARQQSEQRKERMVVARDVLHQAANDLDALRALVEKAAEGYPNLRCASPLSEPLDYAFGPPPPAEFKPVLLAVDGSQDTPSRHKPVEYGVINVGVFKICPGQGTIAPREIVRSQLLYNGSSDLDLEREPLNEEKVAMLRDLNERHILAELAATEQQPVITLTDGPLELFHEPREDRRSNEQLEEYLDVLEKLAGMNVAAAGYVDKPKADLLVRLLELVMLRDHPESFGHEHPLHGVTDELLYKTLLQPGQRSAVFRLQFKLAARYAKRLGGRMAFQFFYLNVGRPGHAEIARVEVPAWVASQAWLLNLLHAALLEQCRHTGGRPYPYALHRAHEIAVITFQEREQIMGLVQAELARQGLGISSASNKQGLKDLPHRTRR